MNRAPSNCVARALGLALLLPALAVAQSPAAPGSAPDVPDWDLSERIEALDDLFSSWDRTDSPGCAVGVTHGGREVAFRAYGMADLEHPARNTPSTVFEAGSVSKQFVAAALILLHLDGELSLEDDVRQYVPELPDYGQTITIRHLLTHTSGLRDWGSVASISGWDRGSRTHDHDHVLEILSRQTALNFPVGARYSYSNSGFNLGAVIVDRIQEESFHEFTRERIFRPLGMTSTQWRDDYRRVVPNRSSAYSGSEGAEDYRINRPIEHVHGNGGLLTTVGDLLKWTQALASDHFGEAFTRELLRQGVLTSGRTITYASGIQVAERLDRPVVEHTGSTAGYRAYLGRYPDRELAVAMLCNVTAVPTGGTGEAIAEIFLDGSALEDAESNGSAARPPPSVEVPSDDLRTMAGIYTDEHNHGPTEIVYENGGLETAGGIPLTAVSGKEFRVGDSDTHYSFLPEEGTDRHRVRIVREGYEEEHLVPANPARELSEADLREFEGTYTSVEADTEIVVRVRDGALVAQRSPASEWELEPAYEDAFRGFGLMRFHRDSQGRITEFSYSAGRVYDLRFHRH